MHTRENWKMMKIGVVMKDQSIHDDLESFFMSLQNKNGMEKCFNCQKNLKKTV